jgi:hypothetical protein
MMPLKGVEFGQGGISFLVLPSEKVYTFEEGLSPARNGRAKGGYTLGMSRERAVRELFTPRCRKQPSEISIVGGEGMIGCSDYLSGRSRNA